MAYPKPETARIAQVAKGAGASWYPKGSDWDAVIYRNQLHYRDADARLSVPLPRLPGEHQAMNAALAIALLRHQSKLDVPDAAIRAAMGWTEWPARLQRLSKGPLTALLPEGTPLWIDGCHNPASAEVVAKQLPALVEGRSLHIICGVLANKDAQGILAPFTHIAESFQTVPIPGHPHHDASELARWLQGEGRAAGSAESVADALEALGKAIGPSGAVLIIGSLYLAWLTAAYFMTNVTANLLLVKYRQQFGLQPFIRYVLAAYAVTTALHLFLHGFWTSVAVRAMSGAAASGLTTLTILYFFQAMPAPRRLAAVMLGICIPQLATPIARILSPGLLHSGDWHTLYLFELGLALATLAAVMALPLPPSEREKVFEPLDFLTFGLLAPGLWLFIAVLSEGRIEWWTEKAWMGWSLAASVGLVAAGLFNQYYKEMIQ